MAGCEKKKSCSSDLATQHRCPPPCHSGWRISLTRLTRGRLQARQAPSCLHGKFSRDLIRPGVLWLYAECNLERSFIMGLTSTIPSISAVEWEDKYILAWNFKIPHPTLYTSCARFNGEEYKNTFYYPNLMQSKPCVGWCSQYVQHLCFVLLSKHHYVWLSQWWVCSKIFYLKAIIIFAIWFGEASGAEIPHFSFKS